ncbi:MAG: radical SAM protein, partial [Thermodesulfobacteriota bacterium]|nr:radical SAM protein [Thermodesulfobacteriota bacterium]
MNEYDSDYVGQTLVNLGFIPTNAPKNADLILINTCMVRAKAEQKAVSLIGRMIPLKKRNPDLILGITGCMAQHEGSNLMKRFPDLDLVLGTREIYRFKDIVNRIYSDREKVVCSAMDLKTFPPVNTDNYFKGRVKSYIPIMQGCNNYCTYCIVPYVRGREISRSPGDILHEARLLVSQGVKEITLLGQNVNSYCWREKTLTTFPRLLRKLNELEGLARIRFTTSHPKDISDELIRCYGDLNNL